MTTPVPSFSFTSADRRQLILLPMVSLQRVAQEFSALQMSEVRISLARHPDLTRIGKLSHINAMAKRLNAQYVIHTGDFGFYDDESLDRMNEKYASQSDRNLPNFVVEHSNMSFNTVLLFPGLWVRHSPDPIPTKL